MTRRLKAGVVAAMLVALVVAERASGQAQSGFAVPADLGPNETYTGVPWTGAPGITATVAQIMQRQALAPLAEERRPGQTRRPLEKSQNPAAPPEPAWPPDAASRSVAPSVGFTLSTSWLATQYSDSLVLPPDTIGAAGPTQIMVTLNGRIKVFDKAGTLGSLNVTDATFFDLVRAGAGVSDPHVRYDRLSGRWFITEINVANTSNRILIAVSSGPTITDTSSFTFFGFDQDAVGPTPNIDTGNFADYDTLGVDAHALYIGANMFTSVSMPTFESTSAWVVNKANLLAGELTVTAFRGLATPSSTGPYTPQGVDNDDASATEGYFIGADLLQFGKLVMRRVTNPGGTPSISGNLNIDVPTTSFPVPQVAQGSVRPLDALDDRLFAAMVKKNRLTGVSSLWTAHNIAVDSGGVGSETGDRNGSRWYQIDNLTGTPTRTQSGTVFRSGADATKFGYWIPSVGANGQGHMALGSSTASSADPASAFVTSRLSSDPAGTTPQTPHTVPGVAGYNRQSATVQRWGDYSQVVVDPNDDQTLWTFQQYTNATDSWGVRVMKLLAPPPVTPTSANPTTANTGVASKNITITGTVISGSGFFDPGSGFASRLTATVSGGVTVNAATFVNATTVTLNISTVGAPAGAKDVTIINPDGQSRTGSGLFSVVTFTDDPLVAGTTVVKAVHVTELRSRIDTQRVRFGLSGFSWSETITAGTTFISAVHIAELRTALAQVYTAAGVTPAPTYTDPVLTAGTTPVKAVHITELRNALIAIE